MTLRSRRWTLLLALALLVATLACLAGDLLPESRKDNREGSTFVRVGDENVTPTVEPTPTPVPTDTPQPTPTPEPTSVPILQPTEIRCEESLPARLSVGMNGIALLEVSVRSEPTRSLDVVIGKLDSGDWFEVWDGPRCVGGWLFWAIDDGRGLIGWLAESNSTRYFVEPLP